MTRNNNFFEPFTSRGPDGVYSILFAAEDSIPRAASKGASVPQNSIRTEWRQGRLAVQ